MVRVDRYGGLIEIDLEGEHGLESYDPNIIMAGGFFATAVEAGYPLLVSKWEPAFSYRQVLAPKNWTFV